ncbi:MAG: hypothetical protein U0263_15180 [Polyangiaceae bacterium]
MSVGYRDHGQSPVVPQGSAYYLHGADGAARDLGLFTLPLVYTNPSPPEPSSACSWIQFADDRFSYAFQGHAAAGMTPASHSALSDLPLFFAWALGEYPGATGDLGVPRQPAAYWPREARAGARVIDHLTGALRHFFDVVGVGEHGLVRMGTGDWSATARAGSARSRARGEKGRKRAQHPDGRGGPGDSIADLLEAREADLAQEIRSHVEGYRKALEKAHNDEFFYRCYFGDGKPRYDGTINLEAQIWAPRRHFRFACRGPRLGRHLPEARRALRHRRHAHAGRSGLARHQRAAHRRLRRDRPGARIRSLPPEQHGGPCPRVSRRTGTASGADPTA